MKVNCLVNNANVVAEVPPRLLLSDFLRHELRLTGTHVGCEMGICGACTIILDGDPVRSCLMFAAQIDECELTTIEGLAVNGELSSIQKAFSDHNALQCGFCTPGFIMTVAAVLQSEGLPCDENEIRELLSGTLCRCTGYQNIVDAIMALSAAARQFEVNR